MRRSTTTAAGRAHAAGAAWLARVAGAFGLCLAACFPRPDVNAGGPVIDALDIVGGDSVEVQLRLEPIAATRTVVRPPPADADPRDAQGGANTALWLSAGATTVLAGATATFAVLASRENSELDRELRQYQENPARLDDTRSRVRTYAALADGFGVAALVGLGATLYFAVTGPDEDTRPADRAGELRWLIGTSGVSVRKDF